MTTTTMKLSVNLMEKTAVYIANCLITLGFRIEHLRVGSDYMRRHLERIEAGFKTWAGEFSLETVVYEVYSPQADKAYEKGVVTLEYYADPTEEQEDVKPVPTEDLETLCQRLAKLPDDAKFRVVVTLGPNASTVPGWSPTYLRELMGGAKEDVDVGSFGFGHASGTLQYRIGNWSEEQQGQPHES